MKTDLPPVPLARVSPSRGPSLRRERLERSLERLWDHRLAVLIALAGSGKTTLLNQFAETVPTPVAWYRAEPDDRTVERVLHSLGMSFAVALSREPQVFTCVEELVEALEAWTDRPTLLVLDDFHTLRGSSAEGTVERLVTYAPPAVRILIASRSYPGFDLSRLRVSGDLLELTADDLRFRSWEVERLFRDFYGEPLQPQDLATLARRTEGWAAGLQLFHLATRGKPKSERRNLVAALSSRSRIARDYLARNLLDGLPDDIRSFMVRTSALGRLTGALCDELLERSGSEEVLQDLEQQQMFTVALSDGGYRYHEALRAHLHAALVEELNGAEVRQLHRRAATLLEGAGAISAALAAHCRAEEWDRAECLLRQQGEQLAADRGSWLETVPPVLLDHDPWLLLVTARRYTALGCLEKALDSYRRAEESFGCGAAGEVCRRERRVLAAWLDPASTVGGDWMGILRAALRSDPSTAARQASALAGAPARFAGAAAELLAGRASEARRLLVAASELPDASPVLALVCRLLAAVASVVSGTPPAGEVELLAEEADLLDLPLLARLCRATLALEGPAGLREAAAIEVACRHQSDQWGASAVAFLRAVGALWWGEPASGLFEASAQGFHDLGAGVAEAWARSGAALALDVETDCAGGASESRHLAVAARLAQDCARSAGVRGAEVGVMAALAVQGGERRPELVTSARAIAAERKWPWPGHLEQRAAPGASVGPRLEPAPPIPSPRLHLRCFGGFRLTVDGRAIDGMSVKPRCRAVLHILALHAGRPVHRELLLDALWPSSDARTGIRNLHVAISTLRQLLEPRAQRAASSLILRTGDAYHLAVAEGDSDVLSFEAALVDARRARACGDVVAAKEALGRGIEAYGGDLLPEDGPSEWVIKRRECFRMDATDAAHTLATLRFDSGDLEGTAALCQWGIRIDHYRDDLWRLLIDAHDAAGRLAAGERARRSYAQVMCELGLTPPDLWSDQP